MRTKGQFTFAFSTSAPRRRLVTAVIAGVVGLTIFLVAITACSANTGADPRFTSEVTPPIENRLLSIELTSPGDIDGTPLPQDVVYGKAMVTNGVLDYKIWGQDTVSVQAIEEVPVGNDVRIWSNDSIAKIALEDGSAIVLEPFTTVYLVYNELNNPSPIIVSLERGSILIGAGNVGVTTADQKFQIGADGSMVGVRYEPLQNMITVNCFGPKGSCSLNGLGESNELAPGEQLSYKDDIRGEVRNADFEGERVFYEDILPTPTLTQTIPFMPTPAVTSTPAATSTAAPATAIPTKSNPGDQDIDPGKDDGGGGGGDGGSGG